MQPITKSQIIQQLEFQDTDTVLAFAKSANEAVNYLLAQRGFVRDTSAPDPVETTDDAEVAGGKEQAESDDASAPDAIPADFPHAKEMAAGGITLFGELDAFSDAHLLMINGIGPATVKRIRAARAAQ